MTVESTDRRTECPGNDSGTVFSSVFAVQAAAHLSVTHVATDGTETALVLNTDYEVALAETGVAAVTFPKGGSGWSTLATGETLVIVRDVPLTQELDLQNYGEFNVELVERALDRAAMVDQQLQEQLDRALVFPVGTSPGTDPETYAAEVLAARDAAQAAQSAAEAAQAAAETAETNAETAQAAAELAETHAETAEANAETAQGLAEDARDAAVVAQGLAETAQGLAEDARDAAAASASAASGSAGVCTSYAALLASALWDYGSVADAVGTTTDYGSIV